MGSERRGRAVHGRLEVNPSGKEPTDRPRQKNAGLWEPYDGRLSRTVLREREGEVPSRHSPGQRTDPIPGVVSMRDDVDKGFEHSSLTELRMFCAGDYLRGTHSSLCRHSTPLNGMIRL